MDRALPNPSKNPDFLAGNYIFGGILFDHFGHLLTEGLHRLWLIDQPPYRGWKVLFVANPGNPYQKTVLPAVMELFGVSDYMVINQEAVVEKLAIGEMGRQFRLPSTSAYVDWLKHRVDLDKLGDAKYPKKLCVLRSHLWTGRLFGEAHVEDWLASDGYHILRPEEHPLHEQLRFLVNAEQIVFSEGSALHLLDLLPPIKGKVALLQRRPHSRLAGSSVAQKVTSLDVFSAVAPSLHYRNRPLLAPHNALSFAPLNEIRTFLVDRGFLSRQSIQYGYLKKAYTNDLLHFSRHELFMRDRPNLSLSAQMERAIEDLLIDHRNAVEALGYQRFLKNLLRAKYHHVQGCHDRARGAAAQALHLQPDSVEANALLAEIERDLEKERKFLPRMTARIRRAFKMLLGRPTFPAMPSRTQDSGPY